MRRCAWQLAGASRTRAVAATPAAGAASRRGNDGTRTHAVVGETIFLPWQARPHAHSYLVHADEWHLLDTILTGATSLAGKTFLAHLCSAKGHSPLSRLEHNATPPPSPLPRQPQRRRRRGRHVHRTQHDGDASPQQPPSATRTVTTAVATTMTSAADATTTPQRAQQRRRHTTRTTTTTAAAEKDDGSSGDGDVVATGDDVVPATTTSMLSPVQQRRPRRRHSAAHDANKDSSSSNNNKDDNKRNDDSDAADAVPRIRTRHSVRGRTPRLRHARGKTRSAATTTTAAVSVHTL